MSKTVKKATAVVGCAMLASSAIVAPAMAIESNGTCDAVAIQDVCRKLLRRRAMMLFPKLSVRSSIRRIR